MQIICTLLQIDNHASTLSLIFYRPDALPDPNQQCQSTECSTCIDCTDTYRHIITSTSNEQTLTQHTLLCTETRIGPLGFQAGCRRRRLNLCVYFVLYISFVAECVLSLYSVRFCFFSIPSQEIGFGNVSEITYFVSSGT